MPKFFVTSDVHSHLTPFIRALGRAGFDPENPHHWLVICGDVFDRGDESLELLKYLTKIERKILVKGNHETLLLDCLQRQFPYQYDWQNGTAKTVIDLAPKAETFADACIVTYGKVKDFIYSMVDYFETENYIFVHSWVPLTENWREAHHSDWENIRWVNPYECIEMGVLPDKTIVFGHWHCSTGWSKAEGRSEFGKDAKFDPFYGRDFVSIDACTAYTKKCNVIVIEDEFLKETE